MERGLLLVFIGNAKDTTLSAVGQVLRALGAGLKIYVFQFRPGSPQYGALSLLERTFDVEIYGISAEHTTQAQIRDLWDKASEIMFIKSGLVVLLEPSCLLNNDVVGDRELVEVIQRRAASLHVLVAGGPIPDSLLQKADLVTEVAEVSSSAL